MEKLGILRRLAIGIWVKATLLFTCAMSAFGEDQSPPNVVLMFVDDLGYCCLLYTSPSPRDGLLSRMPSSA